MTLWKVTTSEFDVEFFGTLEPSEVLFEFDMPITFTFGNGELLFLAHLADDDAGTFRYLVSPTSDETITSLKAGSISLRGAIRQPIIWIVDVREDWLPVSAWVSSPDEVPRDAIPSEGVMLLPELQPLLRLRVVGRDIIEGSVDADLISATVKKAQAAFKTLADFVQSQATDAGQWLAPLRDRFDLRAQQLAFGSLEISFREPDTDSIDELPLTADEAEASRKAMRTVVNLLSRGIKWTASGDQSVPLKGTPEEQRVILRCVKNLTPGRGQSAVDISGRIVADPVRHVRLRKSSRNKVNRALKNLGAKLHVGFNGKGYIEELDLGRSTFILRRINGTSREQKCSYGSDLKAKIRTAFRRQSRVRVVGTKLEGANVVEAAEIRILKAL